MVGPGDEANHVFSSGFSLECLINTRYQPGDHYEYPDPIYTIYYIKTYIHLHHHHTL